jgi:hypothetical protein
MRLGAGRLREGVFVEDRFFLQCSSLMTRFLGVLWLRFRTAGTFAFSFSFSFSLADCSS